jgi:hypothetical protein
VVKNSSDRAKNVLIERAIDSEWKLAQPAAAERARAVHRLSIEAKPGETSRLVALEERDIKEEFALISLDPSDLAIYLKATQATAPLKKALEEAITRRTAVAAIQSRRTEVERRLAELATEQQRVRDNLKAIPAVGTNNPADPNQKASRDLTKRYLDKLASVETELETSRQQLVGLRWEELKANEELKTFLGTLVVE